MGREMKEAIQRLILISFSVIVFLFCLLVLVVQVKDPLVIRLHPVLKGLKAIELIEKVPSLSVLENRLKKSRAIIGLHLYPSKYFWLASSNLKDKTYFTKEDLLNHSYVRWRTLLKNHPRKKFFLYIHSQNPVDLFKFLKASEGAGDQLLIYSDFLKTAAWFRKEAPLMAISLSPTVLLRLNFFSRLWLEGVIPVRAHFAYIKEPKIRLQVLQELERRGVSLIIKKELIHKSKENSKKEQQFIENTFLIKNYQPLIKIKGL